jgi:anti-anti-sigma regulatory factor
LLRVEIQDSENTLILKLEGRFTGNEAENTRTLVTHCHIPIRFVVDLTEITFIDSLGEEVLSFLGQLGAEFVAETSYSLDACERLRLRVARNGHPK